MFASSSSGVGPLSQPYILGSAGWNSGVNTGTSISFNQTMPSTYSSLSTMMLVVVTGTSNTSTPPNITIKVSGYTINTNTYAYAFEGTAQAHNFLYLSWMFNPGNGTTSIPIQVSTDILTSNLWAYSVAFAEVGGIHVPAPGEYVITSSNLSANGGTVAVQSTYTNNTHGLSMQIGYSTANSTGYYINNSADSTKYGLLFGQWASNSRWINHVWEYGGASDITQLQFKNACDVLSCGLVLCCANNVHVATSTS